METIYYLMVTGGLLFGLVAHGANAAERIHAIPPTGAQMQAVQVCAEAKGITMPMPPAAKSGEKPTKAPAEKLTKEQREVIDGCFKEAGLTPHKAAHGSKHESKGSSFKKVAK